MGRRSDEPALPRAAPIAQLANGHRSSRDHFGASIQSTAGPRSTNTPPVHTYGGVRIIGTLLAMGAMLWSGCAQPAPEMWASPAAAQIGGGALQPEQTPAVTGELAAQWPPLQRASVPLLPACATTPPTPTYQLMPAPAWPRPRNDATAVTLLSGDVLITGGSADGGASNEADVFRVDGGGWLAGSPMRARRESHQVAVLPDGRVVAAGGYGVPVPGDGRSILSSVEIRDEVTGTWSDLSPMGNPRVGHHLAALPSGELIVVGGFRSRWGPDGLWEIERLAAPGQQWALLGQPMLFWRESAVSVPLSDGRIMLLSGFHDSTGNLPSYTGVEVYNPSVEPSLRPAAPTPVPVRVASAVTLNNWGVVLAAREQPAELHAFAIRRPDGALHSVPLAGLDRVQLDSLGDVRKVLGAPVGANVAAFVLQGTIASQVVVFDFQSCSWSPVSRIDGTASVVASLGSEAVLVTGISTSSVGAAFSVRRPDAFVLRHSVQ